MNSNIEQPNIKIGISACLAGQEVRFDKSHKRSSFAMDALGQYAEYQPFCPEMAIGMPTPRPTVRQIRHDDVIHVSRPDGSGDVTDAMIGYGKKVAEKTKHLSAFIFCAKSPSCGMERVKVYSPDGKSVEHDGVGLFAKQIMQANPLLPCEENGRLNDPVLRENFVLRVFVYNQWLKLQDQKIGKHQLTQFHSQHKYLLMSHHVESYKQLGRLLATSELSVEELAQAYISGLMKALKRIANRRSHTNTLMHLLGYFKRELNAEQKKHALEQIQGYRNGHLPLFAPLTLLSHFLQLFPKPYLQQQSYFQPYPIELRLRYGY